MKIINTNIKKVQLTLGPGWAPLALVTHTHRWEKRWGKATNTQTHTFSQSKGPGQRSGNTPVHPSQSLKRAGGNTQVPPRLGFYILVEQHHKQRNFHVDAQTLSP